MKKSELTFRVSLVPLDYLAALIAGWLAYGLRFGLVAEVRPVLFQLTPERFAAVNALVALGAVVALALGGAYTLRSGRRALDEIRRVFLGCTVALAAATFLVFLRVELFSSRFMVLVMWGLALVLVGLVHLSVRAVQRAAYRRGRGVHRCLLVGSDEAADALATALAANPAYGLAVVRRVPALDNSLVISLRELHQQLQLDEIIMADTSASSAAVLQVKQYCDSYQLTFRYVASLLQAQSLSIDIETIGGLPVVEVLRTRLAGWGRVFKRAFDLMLGLLAALVALPFGLIIAACIKLNTPGPVLVGLPRVGADGRTFRVFKFRSMIKDAHLLKNDLIDRNERSDGPLFKLSRDPRVTSVGSFLRRFSIDEWPQVLNVLAGSMSLVGPRPHEPGEVERYDQSARKLLAIKPGITGLAQISGRSSLKFADEVRLDTFYVENWTPWLDLQIILKTPGVVIGGREAV